MQDIQAAFCGSAGAYAHIALRRLFPDAATVPFGDFTQAYRSVENGQCELAVLPLENSFAGEIGTVTDLVFTGGLYIALTAELPVRHCLLCADNADSDSVRTVVSHPQALSQCAGFIRSRGLKTEASSSTASAAEYVKIRGDASLAAIASEDAAEIYGLSILERHINDAPDNTTKFAVFSREPDFLRAQDFSGNDRFVLVFTVRDNAGALAEALSVLGAHGYNLSVVRSRPMRQLQWKYYFYAEAEGSADSENGRTMLRELSAVCTHLRLVGSFKAVILDESRPDGQ